jgi:protein-S-isoprenylcysteine O-methyltransferase Ste14
MDELLDALGVRRPLARTTTAIACWLAFAGAMCVAAVGQAVSERHADASTAMITLRVAVVWIAWSVWHSVIFERNRQRYLGHSSNAYRRAFVCDILPGVSIGFSQMLRPAWNGSNLSEGVVVPSMPDGIVATLAVVAGLTVFAGACTLFVTSWRTLGAGKVGFVAEFVRPDEFRPVRRGPYGRMRHPLFWSGIGFSWALALCTRTPAAVAVATVNVLYGFVYNQLEDRRLRMVFGHRYREYARSVPRIVPGREWHEAK